MTQRWDAQTRSTVSTSAWAMTLINGSRAGGLAPTSSDWAVKGFDRRARIGPRCSRHRDFAALTSAEILGSSRTVAWVSVHQ